MLLPDIACAHTVILQGIVFISVIYLINSILIISVTKAKTFKTELLEVKAMWENSCRGKHHQLLNHEISEGNSVLLKRNIHVREEK